MASISKLSIRGIRSFSHERDQVRFRVTKLHMVVARVVFCCSQDGVVVHGVKMMYEYDEYSSNCRKSLAPLHSFFGAINV